MFLRMKIRKQKICLACGFCLIMIFLAEKLPKYHTGDNVTATTVIIADVENQGQSVLRTIDSLMQFKKNLDILIVMKKIPYPPINFPKLPFLQFILEDQILLGRNYVRHDLYSVIKSDYVFIITPGISFKKLALFNLENILQKNINKGVKILSIPVNASEIMCLGTKFKHKEWTVQYYPLPDKDICDAVSRNHVMFMKTSHFLSLPGPLLHPLSQSLYLQSVFNEGKSKIVSSDEILLTYEKNDNLHNIWKQREQHKDSLKGMYRSLGIKLVQGPDGNENWYGCSKETARCFPTVINDMPDYLYMDRWTPPCCLQHLRTTARHLFRTFSKQGVRFWLEGGSLLGAARNGDIIPWDYDVDVGIYEEDIVRSEYLVGAKNGPVVDTDGFVWEMVREGKFFRLQYSASNHLHVDIFPFYSRNGIMTKDSWILTHRQDREFPEHFLKPLTKITFIGEQMPAPNNWTKFLEYKFGKGVISNPKYPNSENVRKT